MGNTTFELRAHNFASAHSDMVIKHLFTFSISVRLPWAGRRWNAYYKWLENVTPSARASLGDLPPITVIATGFGLSPTYYNSSESMPKDVIGYEAKEARLHYVRKKGGAASIKLDVRRKKFQTLPFKMLETTAVAAEGEFVMEGLVALADLSKKPGETGQQLTSGDPFSAPPFPSWRRGLHF